jgi:hypothetical protein
MVAITEAVMVEEVEEGAAEDSDLATSIEACYG